MSLRNEHQTFLRNISSCVREIDYRQQTVDALLREAKRELGIDNPGTLERHFPMSLIFRDYQREIRAVHDNAVLMHQETEDFWISLTDRFGGDFSQETPWELAKDAAAMATHEDAFHELQILVAPHPLRAGAGVFYGVGDKIWSPGTHLSAQGGCSSFDVVTRACVRTLLIAARSPRSRRNAALGVFRKLNDYVLFYLLGMCVDCDIWRYLRILGYSPARPSSLFT